MLFALSGLPTLVGFALPLAAQCGGTIGGAGDGWQTGIKDRTANHADLTIFSQLRAAGIDGFAVCGIVGNRGGSEFLQAVAAAPAEKAWKVMDDLMDTLSAVNPRVYASVMRKIDALREE